MLELASLLEVLVEGLANLAQLLVKELPAVELMMEKTAELVFVKLYK